MLVFILNDLSPNIACARRNSNTKVVFNLRSII